MDLGPQASVIGTLAESTRRRLYDYVVARDAPVGREQAAQDLGLARHTVSFHLDRLAAEGLLDVDYQRLTDRTGPGAGRPSKLYRRADREFAVSLPPRRYDLVGDILAVAVSQALTGAELAGSVGRAAREAGLRAGAEAAAGATGAATAGAAAGAAAGASGVDDPLEDLARALEPLGYEPRRAAGEEDGAMVLANCPYHALAQEHTQLVCGLNQDFVQGVADGRGCTGVRACLEPAEERCCVVARLRES